MYTWGKDGAILAFQNGGPTARYIIQSAAPSNAGTWQVTASNRVGSAMSNTWTLTVH